MNALEKNIAVARGEAVASQLMGTAALQMLFMMIPNPSEALSRLTAYMDDSLNAAGPGKGDANDEFNTHLRETARFHVMQALQHIEDALRSRPAKG